VNAASNSDCREPARRRLPPFLFEYIDGGSYSEVTPRRNISDLAGLALPRVLCDVSAVDTRTALFGLLVDAHLPGTDWARRDECPSGRVPSGARHIKPEFHFSYRHYRSHRSWKLHLLRRTLAAFNCT
jgi:hypothetical protein